MMNVADAADEAEIVYSFIFKNAWAMENLDKICGQHSLPVTRTEFGFVERVETKDQP